MVNAVIIFVSVLVIFIIAISVYRNSSSKDENTKLQEAMGNISDGNDSIAQKFTSIFSLNAIANAENIILRLHKAGYNHVQSRYFFIASKILFPLLLSGLLFLFVDVRTFTETQMLILYGLVFIVGFFAPDLFIYQKMKTRFNEIIMSIPDFTDLLSMGLGAGLTIERSIKQSVDAMDDYSKELVFEMRLLLSEFSIADNKMETFDNLYKRLPLYELVPLIVSFRQTFEYGVPIAESVMHAAEDIREIRKISIEEKVDSLPDKVAVPTILFLFPTLFMVILAPIAVRMITSGGDLVQAVEGLF